MLLYIYILFLLYNFVLVSVVQQSVLQNNCTVNPVIIIYIYIYISLHSWASFSPPNPRQFFSPSFSCLFSEDWAATGMDSRPELESKEMRDSRGTGFPCSPVSERWRILGFPLPSSPCGRSAQWQFCITPFAFTLAPGASPEQDYEHCHVAGLRSGCDPSRLLPQEGAPLISVKPECVCSLKKSARILGGYISIRRTIWFFFKISWVISVTSFKKAMLQNSV